MLKPSIASREPLPQQQAQPAVHTVLLERRFQLSLPERSQSVALQEAIAHASRHPGSSPSDLGLHENKVGALVCGVARPVTEAGVTCGEVTAER